VVAVHSTAVQWYSGTVVQQYSGTGQRGVANLAGPGVGRPPLRRHHKHTDQRFAPHHTTPHYGGAPHHTTADGAEKTSNHRK